jgi:hypothetical protein
VRCFLRRHATPSNWPSSAIHRSREPVNLLRLVCPIGSLPCTFLLFCWKKCRRGRSEEREPVTHHAVRPHSCPLGRPTRGITENTTRSLAWGSKKPAEASRRQYSAVPGVCTAGNMVGGGRRQSKQERAWLCRPPVLLLHARTARGKRQGFRARSPRASSLLSHKAPLAVLCGLL